jgi:PAS domain S-box-containing protein
MAPDRRARRMSRVAGSLAVLFGLCGFGGWLLGVPELLQPLGTFAPLSFTAALGVLALGTGLLGLAADRRHALIVGGTTAFGLGIATLTQAGTGFDFGLGLSPSGGNVLGDPNAPFHIPVSTGILFVLAGAAQLAQGWPRRTPRGWFLAGALGTIVVMLCLGIIATRLVTMPEEGSGILSGSSLQVQIAALILGVDLAFVTWSADPSATAVAPWVPLSVGIACLVTVVLLWRTLVTYEQERARDQTMATARTARREIARQVESATRALGRIARFSPEPIPTSQHWASSMLALTREIDGLQGIAWTDRSAVIREYRPTPIPADTIRLDIQRRLASVIASSGGRSWQEVSYFGLQGDGRAFATSVPICPNGECTGHIVGVFDAERLIRPVIDNRDDNYTFRVTSSGQRLIGPRDKSAAPRDWRVVSSFGLGDINWDIAVWPSQANLKRFHTGLSDLLLLLGLLVAALLPLTLRLGQLTLTRARMAERVRLNQALETANDGIWEWEVGSGAAVRSDTFWRHLGYEPARVLPEMDSWISLIHPEDARRVREAIADHLVGKREIYEAEYRVRDHLHEWHWVIDRGRVVERSPTGAPLRMLGISADVTVRKRAEDALREVQSLTTMGRLAARLAHEINNPLAGIQNAFTLIKDAVPESHPHRNYIGAIEREIGRIAGVTRQLYETYRPEQSAETRVSPSSVVGDAVALLEQLNRGSNVRIAVDLSNAPPTVRIPDGLLRQAVYNLVQNAVEASPPGATVSVSAEMEDSAFVFRVRDKGPGVPSEIRERIFEAFFTTKSAGVKTGGMGLGLSMVRHSVQAFGGRVDINDVPGGGAEFVVRLPLTPIEPGVPA